MRIQVVTIFPRIFDGFLASSLVAKAIEDQILEIEIHDLRAFTCDRHQTVDDEPYGGGGGMVMKAGPWIRAVRHLGADSPAHRVLLSPQGSRLDDAKVRSLATRAHLILLCGRYEGVDERVRQTVIDEELSIGDYVLSGGELPAMVVIEAISRQIPGVVGRPDSVENDSFRDGLLDFPHYTRPRDVEGLEVPSVLLSGDHEAIRLWRQRQSLRATLEKRPDLLEHADLSAEQSRMLRQVEKSSNSSIEADDELVNRARGKDNR